MRNTENVRRFAAPNLLVQFSLAELTLQLAVDPSKSRRSIPAKTDGRSQQEPTVDPDMRLHSAVQSILLQAYSNGAFTPLFCMPFKNYHVIFNNSISPMFQYNTFLHQLPPSLHHLHCFDKIGC
jgi:hypothetical protein